MSDALSTDFSSLLPETPFSRRGFLVTALGAGFALAVHPVAAQSAIHTDTQGLAAGEIRVKTPDGEMAAYRAQPAAGGHFPVILVVSEIFGVHEHIADICRRLAKLGYLAIAPELFARQGDPRKIASIQEIMTGIVARVPDAQVMGDLDACVDWAAAHGGDAARLGITGFCWGGRITWLYAAHNARLKAAVAWYGRLAGDKTALTPQQPLDLAGRLKAPVLGLYGGADAGISLDTIWDMQDKLKAAGGQSMIHVYDDAPHAFHADYRPSYRKEAAEDGWRRMRDWFRSHGV
ncbi:MAG TPA: dienelactone hydrolase family protein [Candidatus Desulfobacillus sp.]|nr:dienelactone hydrolase family protein [Candidatus Desulfobacillus sp.]